MASEWEKDLWEQTKSDNLSTRGEAYYRLAEVSIHQDNPDRALTLNGQARVSYTDAGDSDGIAESRLQTARILLALERPADAIPELEWCALEYRIDSHESQLAQVMRIEAQAYDALGNVEQSIEHYRSSLRLFISDANAEDAISCSVSFACLLNREARYKDAVDALAEVTHLIDTNDHAYLVGEHAMIGARVQMHLGNRELCFELLDQAKELFAFSARFPRAHLSESLRVEALSHFGDHSAAIECAEQLEEELAAPSTHIRNAANVRVETAVFAAQSQLALENFDEAQRIASSCLALSKATHAYQQASQACWVLGQVAELQGEQELAERMFRQCLEFNEKAVEGIDTRRIKLHLARILVDREEGEEARLLLESFDVYAWHQAHLLETATYFALLMQAYWHLGNVGQTETLAKLVFKNQIIEGACSDSAALAHEFLAEVYARRGDLDNARAEGMKALKMAIELEDSDAAKRLSQKWLG